MTHISKKLEKLKHRRLKPTETKTSKRKCRECKSPMILRAKLYGYIDADTGKFETPYWFEDELYECPNCEAKYKRELNLDKLVNKGIISHRTRRITNILFDAYLKNLEEKNRIIKEDYEFKKKIRELQ